MMKYRPMLAHSAQKAFSSKDWIFEIKWDGIRAISYVNNNLSILSRAQKELKENFPELKELENLAENVVLDGEIVLFKKGKTDFQALLERVQKTSYNIEYLSRKWPVTYVVFDILEKEGRSLIDFPLIKRKKMLKECLKEGKNVLISDFVEEKGKEYYDVALKKSLEGIVAKKKDSPYEPGKRSYAWLKIKKIKTCDCVILGYTKGKREFGALILGLYEKDKPRFVGKVGTGFKAKELEGLFNMFSTLKTKKANFDINEDVTWLKPRLVCTVKYHSVTRDGKLRIPVFTRLRLDKTPEECQIEQIAKPA
jgi:DNA ligase D-like protein (predicted ligase)